MAAVIVDDWDGRERGREGAEAAFEMRALRASAASVRGEVRLRGGRLRVSRSRRVSSLLARIESPSTLQGTE